MSLPATGLWRAITLSVTLVVAACSSRGAVYSGTVQTESIAVGSQSGGRVVAVEVAPGSPVRRGSVILRLDAAELAAQHGQAVAQTRVVAERLAELVNGNVASDVARAQAQSVQAQAQYRQAVVQSQPQIAAAQAAVRDAEAAARLSQITLGRTQLLVASGDESRQSLDQARADDLRARARLAQARARYANLVKAQLPGERSGARANAAAQRANYETVRNGTRREQIAQARAQLAAARAAERYASARLREAVVVAPADGVVESFSLHPGDLLVPDEQAAIIDTFADPFTYIYVSQRDLGALTRGKHLRVVSDADGATYDGRVEAHDRTAQFTPQNVETADQRAELVYGVKVRIHDPKRKLLAGTTISVSPL
jgi:HlyD family secretion protein